MSLWQLDAFEYDLIGGKTVTIYQLLDDSTRFDVGTNAYARAENSTDAKTVLAAAIAAHGPPQEVLSDNSLEFNQLRQGTIGAVEIFLASKGSMPISGLPGKPTTQGKNERSHQTLIRFLDANRPATLEGLRSRIQRFRDHYNTRRPHQALNDATPATAWNLVDHTPATGPIPMAVLEAKAAEYRQARMLRQGQLDRAALTISKTGQILPDPDTSEQRPDQSVVTVTKANRQVYYHGYHVSLPTTFADRQFYRTITDEAFLLTDMVTGEIVFSFPLPMIAMGVRDRFIASYAVQGVEIVNPTNRGSGGMRSIWRNSPPVSRARRRYSPRSDEQPGLGLVVVYKALRLAVPDVARPSVHEVPRFHTTSLHVRYRKDLPNNP